MSQKQIRFSITDKEYNSLIRSVVLSAKTTGKILSIHQYVKKLVIESMKK